MRIIMRIIVDFSIFIVYYTNNTSTITIKKGVFQMNKKTNKKLNNRKNKIEKRVERKNWEDQSSPMFSGSNIHYDIDGRNSGISCGGIGVIQLLAQKIGLIKKIDANLHLLKRHLPYFESDHILNIAYNILAGGTCLDDIDLQRNDDAFLNAIGAEIIPDPTTAGDFLRRFNEQDIIDLMDIKNEVRQKIWEQQSENFKREAVINVDGTICETTGECKESMDIAYNGKWGYHPLIISLANTREPLYIVNRSGNVPSHTNSAEWIDRALELVSGTFDKVYLRGDTDFSLTEKFDKWDQVCTFVFGMDAMPNLVRIAENEIDHWQLLEKEEKYKVKTKTRKRPKNVKDEVVKKRKFKKIQTESEHVGEFSYQPGKCEKEYRIVVLKKKLKVVKGTMHLFDDVRYFFFIGNDWEKEQEEIVKFYRKRADHENDIDQLTNGVKALHAPSNTLLSNWAYMVIAALAWDLKAWYGLLMPNTPVGYQIIRMEFKQFINFFILIPCIIIKTGRKICYNIIGYNKRLKLLLNFACMLRKFSFP